MRDRGEYQAWRSEGSESYLITDLCQNVMTKTCESGPIQSLSPSSKLRSGLKSAR
jgi:hypothetical protein